MASTPKQVNTTTNNNNSSGKRKKSHGSKSSYLSKWLDKTMHQVQAPPIDSYDFVNPNMNWTMGSSQFTPGYDPYRHMYSPSEPVSLPIQPSYYNPPMMPMYQHDPRFMQNVNKFPAQRPRMRRRGDIGEEMRNHSSPSDPSCLPKNNNTTDSQDYTSLPPIITSVADTNSNSDGNDREKEDNTRRFSDPCVHGLPDVTQPGNGDMETDSEDGSSESGSQVGSRLLTCLLDQITSLKLANERLTKDLFDTRAELENIRHHNAILQKSSGSSIGATPNHSLEGGLINGQYSPGFLTDLVREIRDAARMREEALYARVRAMVIERNDNLGSSEAKLTEKALDEIKSSLRASEADKRRMMDRLNKLEDELHALRIANGLDTNDNKMNGNAEETDSERMRLRQEVADMRKAKQAAEEHSHKLERLVTQLRSKFNGHQITNGPDSLPSEPEHEAMRVRRASLNSSNSTVVFGPVTDL